MIYHIDKELSAEHEMLVIRLEGVEKDQEILSLIRKERCEEDILFIPFKRTLKLLKPLASTGNLYFNGKNIVCDFFSRNTLSFYVANDFIQGHIQTRNDLIDLQECSFICGGPSLIFIHGITLKFLATDLSWKLFKQTYYQNPPPTLEQIQDEIIEGDEDSPTIEYAATYSTTTASSVPVLKLVDSSGAFANLWTDSDSEIKEWENDLLETDFIKKKVGQSDYFCPLDKVRDTLAFLLELGWKILDHQNRSVLGGGNLELHTSSDDSIITVKGALSFDDQQASLPSLINAYQKNETFISLDSNTVGLLPKNPQILELAEEGELVAEGVKIQMNQVGCCAEFLRTAGQLDAPLQTLLDSFEAPQSISLNSRFHGELRPYQQAGLDWMSFLYQKGFHGLLADEMGLGKTVQVLAFLSQIKSAVIIVPTSLIHNWKSEFHTFLPDSPVHLHYGPDRESTLPDDAFIITSYGTLLRDLSLFKSHSTEALILDEAQWIKNRKTQVFQAVCQLDARFRLSMTGTPVENRLDDLFSQFHFLMPDLLEAEECTPEHLPRIKKKVRPFILRRTKDQVAKDLPEKIEQNLWIEMNPDQRRDYDQFLSKAQNSLVKKVQVDGLSKHRMEVLETILRLRQICCSPLLVNSLESTQSTKLDVLIHDMETIRSEGKKALIFSQFTSMLGLISNRVREKGWNACYLDGQTKNRGDVIESFQNDSSIPFFLMSLKAGGVGLNLTAADYVLLFDPWWNPAMEDQAINRAHRIGRKDTVIAKRYLTTDSIEEKMLHINNSKKKIASDLLNDNFIDTSLTEEDFLYLLT